MPTVLFIIEIIIGVSFNQYNDDLGSLQRALVMACAAIAG